MMDNEVRAKFNLLSKQMLKEKVTTSVRKEQLFEFAKENNVEISELRKLVNRKANWTIVLAFSLMMGGVFIFVLGANGRKLGITGIVGLISGGTMLYQSSQIRNSIHTNMDLFDE